MISIKEVVKVKWLPSRRRRIRDGRCRRFPTCGEWPCTRRRDFRLLVSFLPSPTNMMRTAIPENAALATNVDVSPKDCHSQPARTLAISNAPPLTRLNRPKAVPHKFSGVLSATRADNSPCESPRSRSQPTSTNTPPRPGTKASVRSAPNSAQPELVGQRAADAKHLNAGSSPSVSEFDVDQGDLPESAV